MRIGTCINPFGYFRGLYGDLSAGRIFGMVAACTGIPILAFGEELLFRGWMTQTLGQYVRFPIVMVAIVAVLFAVYHTQYDWQLKIVMLICSLGFSALSLRDKRLELAVGAHSMMNICAMLQPLLFTGSLSHKHIAAASPGYTWVSVFDVFAIAILKGALPIALMYLILQRTNNWFRPNDTLREAQ